MKETYPVVPAVQTTSDSLSESDRVGRVGGRCGDLRLVQLGYRRSARGLSCQPFGG